MHFYYQYILLDSSSGFTEFIVTQLLWNHYFLYTENIHINKIFSHFKHGIDSNSNLWAVSISDDLSRTTENHLKSTGIFFSSLTIAILLKFSNLWTIVLTQKLLVLTKFIFSEYFGHCRVLCLVAQSCPALCIPVDACIPTRLLCLWGFSRQEYWSGLPCPPPGNLPNFRDGTQVFCITDEFFAIWATREASDTIE